MKKLEFGMVLNDSLSMAFKNLLSLIGTFLLWAITIWIPYLNVGTTIAVLSIPLELSRGNVIKPTFIFDSKYRKCMGEFFILWVLMFMAIWGGMMFFLIPGIVIAIAFSLSIYIMIDKGVNPLQAIKLSNDCTYGNKWRMFFIMLIAVLLVEIVGGIIMFVLSKISIWLVIPLLVCVFLFAWAFGMSINAVFYRELASNCTDVAE